MKKILVIDDNEIFRLLLAEWLNTEGFYPITAEDGFSGIRLAQTYHPDIILCDFNMPAMNGVEVCQKLQSDLNTADIPFCFLTSETSLKESSIQRLGGRKVISKAMGFDELRQVLTAIQEKNSIRQ